MQVRYVFLLDYPLVLSLLKPNSVRVFWKGKKKNSGPNRKSSLNSSIDTNQNNNNNNNNKNNKMTILHIDLP